MTCLTVAGRLLDDSDSTSHLHTQTVTTSIESEKYFELRKNRHGMDLTECYQMRQADGLWVCVRVGHGQGSDDADDDEHEQYPSSRYHDSLPFPSTMPGMLIHHSLVQKTHEVLNRQRVDPHKPTIDDQDADDETAHRGERRKTATPANGPIISVSAIGH